MKVFLDTSSLFKLYHREEGTDALMKLFENGDVETIYVAEITQVEFSSVVWKKCRNNELDENLAQLVLIKFQKDAKNFTFVPDNYLLRNIAQKLISTHWRIGLRTLDAIQLASALHVKDKTELFLTSDKLLSQIAGIEGFAAF